MRKLLSIALAIVGMIICSGVVRAEIITRLDPTLVRDLYLIEQCQVIPASRYVDRLSGSGLTTDFEQQLKVFLHFSQFPDSKTILELQSREVRLFEPTWIPPVGAHATGFMLGSVKASQIRALVKDNLVIRIGAAYRQLRPLNDNAAVQTNATAAWELDPPITGAGVRLAILDSGFQLEHGDLPDPAVAMDYADYPDTSADVTDLISGHGTHVAGTAFGSGALSGGRWKGMAFDAEPIYLKIGNDSTSSASSAATWCEADILTMSYGGFDGFNDGSSEDEQTVDWAVGEGVTCFMSAGNDKPLKRHHISEVAALDTTDYIQLVPKYVGDPIEWSFYLTWRDGADTSVHVELSALLYNGNRRLADVDEMDQVSSLRGAETRQYLPWNPLPNDSTSYFVRVINHSDQAQQFHLYAITDHWYLRWQEFNDGYIVAAPSTADSCISVGAFLSRNTWVDLFGVRHEIGWDSIGVMAYFSAVGPRLDGIIKPDICAPGQRLISCRDSDNSHIGGVGDSLIVSNDYDGGLPADYVIMWGTSMSSPAAAGTAALMLQTNPELDPAQLRRMIFDGARTDHFTGEVPNPVWGWGKIDFVGAHAVPGDDVAGTTKPQVFKLISTYPNPFNSTFSVVLFLPEPGSPTLALHDLNGRLVWHEVLPHTSPGYHVIPVMNSILHLPSGAYLFSAGQGSRRDLRTITLIK
jgi:subtilisin family serine protease